MERISLASHHLGLNIIKYAEDGFEKASLTIPSTSRIAKQIPNIWKE